MHFSAQGGGNANPVRVSARCPHCNKEAVLDQLGQDIGFNNGIICGQRRCPNLQCMKHIFVITQNGNLVAAYPPVRIDFNPDSIPVGVLKTFEEALTCQSNGALIAAAIMVRRTLEEICAERQAKGGNLKARLKDLQSKIVLPQELLDAMDELRLLGNDAAHIEAKEFSEISEEGLLVAIEFTKEILKGIYQYAALLGRLRALKPKQQP